MEITSLYAGLLALLFLALSLRVIQGRGKGIGLGDGGDGGMLRLMRGHANFAEYVPLILLLMALLEYHGTQAAILHGLGAALCIARAAHGYAFCFSDHSPRARLLGAALTLLVLLAAGGLSLWQGIQNL